MNKFGSEIPVIAACHFDQNLHRNQMTAVAGQTLSDIVAQALPHADADTLALTTVCLVTAKGIEAMSREFWHCMRPNAGVTVVIRVAPGKDALRSILTIAVSIAAVALAPGIAAGLGIGGAVGTAVVAVGLTVLGNLLINALIPPSEAEATANSYSINGFKNQLNPNGAVPVVLGTMRVAPPFAARSYSEIVGDDQYVRAMFTLGEDELEIDEFKIGETSLSEYDHVELEVRNGLDGDAPVSLYPTQIVEEQVGVELTRLLPRNDAGEVIDGEEPEDEPVVRTTGKDASGAKVILGFPAGLVRFNEDGSKRSHSVEVRIEQRLIEADEWQVVETLTVTASKAEGFFREHSWTFPTRAQWQVRLTMLTDETQSSQKQQRTNWAMLQTMRPEYPLNYPRPLSLIAMRIKATHQLTGALDNLSVIARRVCLDWDTATQTWVNRATENPASLYRYVLQAAQNAKPVSDAQINLGQLQAWHEFCAEKGLTYNAVLASDTTLFGDVLAEIAAAGRATKQHDGTQWGVVVDNPTEESLIVDHISPRNAWGFKGSRSYAAPPHAFVVTFLDADNDYKQSQRTVRWPDYDGEITVTEALPLPGKVYADEVWREARRRQLETLYRPDQYEVMQEGALRVTTRGDHVMVNDCALSRHQTDARVRKVFQDHVEIDETVHMQAGEHYAIRFRHFDSDDDTIGRSVVRAVKWVEGETRVLTLLGTGVIPLAPNFETGRSGDVIQFGVASFTASQRIITGVERTTDGVSIIRQLDAAPEIDEILEATEIPEWSSRVGDEIADNLLQPSAPLFTSVTSGMSGTDTAGLVTYLITSGPGSVTTSTFEIDHRLSGDVNWNTTTIAAANGGGNITSYVSGDPIEIRARGRSSTGVEGPYSSIVTLTVGINDANIPSALDDDAISMTTLLGGAFVQIVTGSDTSTTGLQLYRSTSAVLDRENDAVGAPFSVAPQTSYSTTLGDTTRENAVTGGNMASEAAWTTSEGWTVSGGVAAHAPITAGTISQPFNVTAGKYYRIGFTVSGASSGSVTPRLTGGSERSGQSVAANGDHSDRVQAVTGNDSLEIYADAAFDGNVDGIVAYLETDGCLSQGVHYVWVEPQNTDGVPGPVSGPFEITII